MQLGSFSAATKEYALIRELTREEIETDTSFKKLVTENAKPARAFSNARPELRKVEEVSGPLVVAEFHRGCRRDRRIKPIPPKLPNARLFHSGTL